MQFFLFFLIVFAVFALGYGYAGWRLISSSGLHQPWSSIAWIIVAICFLLPVISVILDHSGYDNISSKFAWATYVSMGFFSFLFTFVLIRDAGLLIAFLVQKATALFASVDPSASVDEPRDPGRRLMIMQSINAATVGISAGLTAYGVYEARRRPAVKEFDIEIRDLPSGLEGFKIVQITDIHAGLTVKREFVERIVDMVNDLKPDLVAFTGDMVDGSVKALRAEVEPFEKLNANYGVYFVTGNHEYYSGAEEWVAEARRLGMKVLMNEHEIVRAGDGKLLIAGVTDVSGGGFYENHRSDPVKAIAGAPAADARILLAHQPRSLYDALPLGFDLLLTGHTHGGQFFPWNFAASAGQPHLYGLHDHGGTRIYVSKGTGYWGPPVRLGSRSEIAVVTLKRATSLS